MSRFLPPPNHREQHPEQHLEQQQQEELCRLCFVKLDQKHAHLSFLMPPKFCRPKSPARNSEKLDFLPLMMMVLDVMVCVVRRPNLPTANNRCLSANSPHGCSLVDLVDPPASIAQAPTAVYMSCCCLVTSKLYRCSPPYAGSSAPTDALSASGTGQARLS